MVSSVYVCGEYRELCCVTLWVLTREVLLIVVLVMSIQPAWREQGGDLKFVNAPPEGCVWEQWGDLGVMWEVEAGVSEIEVPKVGVKGRLRQCLPFWREVINASPTVLSVMSMAMSSPSWRSPHYEFVGATTQHMRMQNLCEIL